MTIIGHDRKYQAEQRANQENVEQSRADQFAALGCLVALVAIVVVLVIWPGLVMH